METIVLSYPKLRDKIESRANPEKEKSKALKNLREIAADFSPNYIKMMEKVLDTSLPKLYDGVNLDFEDDSIRSMIKNDCVVLVPNHQSHVDYLAINYKFFKEFRSPLYVAGGNNLNIFPIGTFFRKSGCFFIRRSFHSDIIYKLTLEGYLYFLLKKGVPIEFFFEGGRSRSGKLRPPRFGLYQMLLEAHGHLEEAKKLYFIPVSIVHEYVPEQKAHLREMAGAKKVKESTGQLLRIFKLFAYRFGSVHIDFGRPIEFKRRKSVELKKETQDLAFECFREVGKNMTVTPTSLLALILLDEPQGALKWQDILAKAKSIVDFCHKFNIKCSLSMDEKKFLERMERSMDILIGNKKIDVIGKEDSGILFYSIKKEARLELLYSKNTIVHHFLVPWIINSVWINIFNGKIKSLADLKSFFLLERNKLKHEFYLPTVKEFFNSALAVISDCVGRDIFDLTECLNLSKEDLYCIASKVGVFSKLLSYLNEAYYCCGKGILALAGDDPEEVIKTEVLNKKIQSVSEDEILLGRVLKYPENFSVTQVRSCLSYLSHLGIVGKSGSGISLPNRGKLEELTEKFEESLLDGLTFNIRGSF